VVGVVAIGLQEVHDGKHQGSGWDDISRPAGGEDHHKVAQELMRLRLGDDLLVLQANKRTETEELRSGSARVPNHRPRPIQL
jgi:hypothetical protein